MEMKISFHKTQYSFMIKNTQTFVLNENWTYVNSRTIM